MTQEQAIKIASEVYTQHPNYPQKAFHAFNLPMVEKGGKDIGPGDLPGMWYEALYTVAMTHPDKTQQRQLYLVVAYRRFYSNLRQLAGIKRTSPLEWQVQNKFADHWEDFQNYCKLLDEENLDDIYDIYDER